MKIGESRSIITPVRIEDPEAIEAWKEALRVVQTELRSPTRRARVYAPAAMEPPIEVLIIATDQWNPFNFGGSVRRLEDHDDAWRVYEVEAFID